VGRGAWRWASDEVGDATHARLRETRAGGFVAQPPGAILIAGRASLARAPLDGQ